MTNAITKKQILSILLIVYPISILIGISVFSVKLAKQHYLNNKSIETLEKFRNFKDRQIYKSKKHNIDTEKTIYSMLHNVTKTNGVLSKTLKESSDVKTFTYELKSPRLINGHNLVTMLKTFEKESGNTFIRVLEIAPSIDVDGFFCINKLVLEEREFDI